MSYDAQRAALVRTRQELLVLGVGECQNSYANLVPQLLTRTEEFDHADWTKTAVTVVANATDAPDGTTTMDTVEYDAANDAISQTVTGEAVTSKAFTGSVWMAKTGGGQVTIVMRVKNVGGTEIGSRSVVLSGGDAPVRYYVHKLFSGAEVDDVVFELIRLSSVAQTDVRTWGANLHRNTADQDAEEVFPYRKRVAEAEATVSVNASRCEAADAGDGARCFYSRPTCQDTANINTGNTWEDTPRNRGIREFLFCKQDAPLPFPTEPVFPYIISSPRSSQKIDPDRAITINESMTFELQDDAAPGVWNIRQAGDGFLVNTERGAGTFWPRFLAIHSNFSNPEFYAILKVGFVEAGGAESDFQTKGKFLIRKITLENFKARIKCSDRLRLTAQSIPAQISDTNVLVGVYSSGTTTLTVTDGSEITPPSVGYPTTLFIDEGGIAEEKVNVTDINANVLTVQRGRWGTSASGGVGGESFVEVVEFGTEDATPSDPPAGGNPIDFVVEMLARAGLTSSELDTAGFEADRDTYIPTDVGAGTGPLWRRTITEPTDIEEMIKEIRDTINLFVWVDESQMVTGKLYEFSAAGTTFTDDANLVEGSVSILYDHEQRITRVLMAYGLTAGADASDLANYTKVRLQIDADAEDRTYYGGDFRQKTILSPWIPSTETFSAPYFTPRILAKFRHGIRPISGRLEIKDEGTEIGDLVAIDSRQITDEFGVNLSPVTILTMKRETRSGEIEFEALVVEDE